MLRRTEENFVFILNALQPKDIYTEVNLATIRCAVDSDEGPASWYGTASLGKIQQVHPFIATDIDDKGEMILVALSIVVSKYLHHQSAHLYLLAGRHVTCIGEQLISLDHPGIWLHLYGSLY